ncbi:uncharacterized protein si:ch211-121a2.4 isoform X1 [Oncorhynchus nerka]|uniref:uncharacterized protein si:ch211-121a2.4 isoform X1 n=1 Tax=Oncorhynchus nerka TaxID=8023 RepID=UPI0031B871E0
MCERQTGSHKKWVECLPYLYNPGPKATGSIQRSLSCLAVYAQQASKVWRQDMGVACDTQFSYAWKMQVYTGKPTSGGPEKNQVMQVVLGVTDGLRGHNVTCDNFFTSYELSQQLQRKITMVGTVRKNEPEIPLHSTQRGREAFLSKFAFTTTLVSYLTKRNKNMVLLSTLHKMLRSVIIRTGSQTSSWTTTTTKEVWTR